MESPIDRNGLFSGLYGFFAELTPDGFGWLAYLLAGGIIVFIVVNGVLMLTAADTYMERRVLGRFQTRLGPNRVGPFGLLQPLADVLKLIMKEDLRPAMADRLTFFLAPVLMVAAILLAAAVVPFGPDTFLADLNIGVLYFVGIPTIATVAMFLGGWGSGNRFALLGAARAVAMLISYEVPMIVSLAGVLLLGRQHVTGRRGGGAAAPVHRAAAAGVLRLPRRRLRRDEPHTVRPDGGGIRADGGLPHRVQRHPIRAAAAWRSSASSSSSPPCWRCSS